MILSGPNCILDSEFVESKTRLTKSAHKELLRQVELEGGAHLGIQ